MTRETRSLGLLLAMALACCTGENGQGSGPPGGRTASATSSSGAASSSSSSSSSAVTSSSGTTASSSEASSGTGGGALAAGGAGGAGGAASNDGGGGGGVTSGGGEWAGTGGGYSCGGQVDPGIGPYVEWFENITGSTGIDAVGSGLAQTSIGSGVAVADMDGDGLLDVAVATGPTGPTYLYKNVGGLHFVDVTAAAGAAFLQGYGVAFADIDDDGDQDLVVTGQGAVGIYENLDGLHFADDTAASGLTSSIGPVHGVLLADLDGNGLIDLYFLDRAGNRAFKNLGAFQFADVSVPYNLRVSAATISWAAALWDCDGDGALDVHAQSDADVDDPDLGLPPAHGGISDKLLRNRALDLGLHTFSDIASMVGVAAPRSSMGDVIADFDRDGRLDFYVSNIGKKPLYLEHGGAFVESADLLGVEATRRVNDACAADSTDRNCLLTTWGSALFDADHDGLDDLVMVNGQSGSGDHSFQPSRVLRGRPNGTFMPVESAIGCMNARALVPADLDNDGDIDLLATTIAGPVRVFRNDAAPDQGWLRVRFVGTTSNRDGIGALATLELGDGRKIVRAVGAGGIIFSSAPVEAHFTTGGQPITGLDVRWPSGALQHVGPVASNQILPVLEP